MSTWRLKCPLGGLLALLPRLLFLFFRLAVLGWFWIWVNRESGVSLWISALPEGPAWMTVLTLMNLHCITWQYIKFFAWYHSLVKEQWCQNSTSKLPSKHCVFTPHTTFFKIRRGSCHRNIAFHPSYCFHLSMKWCGKVYVDFALPFVLLSAHYIFNCV